jgi:uncharacterized protein (TIGR04255 family)
VKLQDRLVARRPLVILASAGSYNVPDLASYSRSPVVEVALAVQFEPGTVTTLDVAAFRASIRSDFPRYEEQPARPPIEEVFETVPAGIPFRFEMLTAPPMSRFWFLSEEGSRLVQLQSDLLAVNWRLLPEGGNYPRYEVLRGEIERHLQSIDAIVQMEGRPALRPNWCEVTYINHVAPNRADEDRPPLEDVLAIVAPPRSERFLPPPEDFVIRQRFLIGGDEKPRGRLTVDAASAVRNVDAVPIWALTFTSRVRALEGGLKDALEALDLGREWAVRGFEDLISQEMQQEWGLRKKGSEADLGG